MCTFLDMGCAEIAFQFILVVAGVIFAIWYEDLGKPSSLANIYCRIKAMQFDASIICRELPMNS